MKVNRLVKKKSSFQQTYGFIHIVSIHFSQLRKRKYTVIFTNFCVDHYLTGNINMLSIILIILELSCFSYQSHRRTLLKEVELKGTRNWTDPIQQEHSTFIHVEMGFDAFWLGVCVLQKAASHARQFDCGQVERAEHTAECSQHGQKKTQHDLESSAFSEEEYSGFICWGQT